MCIESINPFKVLRNSGSFTKKESWPLSVFISEKEGRDWQEHSSSEMRLGKINIFNKSGRSNEAPTNANYRGVGLSDMIESINKNILNRCNGELALHVLDMIDSTISAALTCEEKLLRTMPICTHNCQK